MAANLKDKANSTCKDLGLGYHLNDDKLRVLESVSVQKTHTFSLAPTGSGKSTKFALAGRVWSKVRTIKEIRDSLYMIKSFYYYHCNSAYLFWLS